MSRGGDTQEAPPSYAEASTSSSHAQMVTTDPALQQYTSPPPVPQLATRNSVPTVHASSPQRYSSLLPPGEKSPGPPPNYEVATSSLHDPIRRRPESPERMPRRSHLYQFHESLGGPKPPPKPEGVPLEEVVDRFGNRKRELKFRTLEERRRNPISMRAAYRSGSKLPLTGFFGS